MVYVVYRADLKRDLIKPVTKATVGQIYCAYFSEDKEWHRASVVATLSTSHVSYFISMNKSCIIIPQCFPIVVLVLLL